MTFVIGDVHGCFHTLTSLLSKIKEIDPNPQLVFVGDYVDRGLNTRECIDLLIELQKEGAICLRGNHDDVIDYLLNNHIVSYLSELITIPETIDKVVRWWSENGLIQTLDSYGCTVYRQTRGSYGMRAKAEEIVEEFREKVPETHKEFIRHLKMFWDNITHFSCHAYFYPYTELPRDFKFVKTEQRHQSMWNRFTANDVTNGQLWDKIGVFGHTPVHVYGPREEPISQDKLRLIDCGCFMNKRLIAYCCEDDNYIEQIADERDIDKKWIKN